MRDSAGDGASNDRPRPSRAGPSGDEVADVVVSPASCRSQAYPTRANSRVWGHLPARALRR